VEVDPTFLTSTEVKEPLKTAAEQRPKIQPFASMRHSYATQEGLQMQREKIQHLFDFKHKQATEREQRNIQLLKNHDKKWKSFERRARKERDKKSQ
jgi:hypothetical protein